METVNTATSEAGNGKVVVPNSDGYLIEVEEGTIWAQEPTPPPPKKKRNRRARKDRPSRKPRRSERGKNNPRVKAALEAPGLDEWLTARSAETRALSLVKQGAPVGQTKGYTVRQATKIWKVAKRRAKEDMAEIKKKIDLSEAAEEALNSVLTVMRGPVSTKDQLAAASKVLEYTMAKPVAKSEVTVNAAEAWLASLKDEETEE